MSNEVVDDIDEQAFDHQHQRTAHEQGVDSLPGQIADIEPAHIAAYHAIDDNGHERYGIDQ